MTLQKLKYDHASYPRNPHLAETLYQAGYIERFGTGTGEIYRLCKEAGLPEPLFNLEEGFSLTIYRPSTDQATDQATDQVNELVRRLILVLTHDMSRSEIMDKLELRHRYNFNTNYLQPAIDQGFVFYLFPESPNSPDQKYRLTEKGNILVSSLKIDNIHNTIVHDTAHDSAHDTAHDLKVLNPVERLVFCIEGEMHRDEIMGKLELTHRQYFKTKFIDPAIYENLVEMTLPDKPTSKNQQYRLTTEGLALQNKLKQ